MRFEVRNINQIEMKAQGRMVSLWTGLFAALQTLHEGQAIVVDVPEGKTPKQIIGSLHGTLKRWCRKEPWTARIRVTADEKVAVFRVRKGDDEDEPKKK